MTVLDQDTDGVNVTFKRAATKDGFADAPAAMVGVGVGAAVAAGRSEAATGMSLPCGADSQPAAVAVAARAARRAVLAVRVVIAPP